MHNFFDLLITHNKASASLQKILEKENIDPNLSFKKLIAVTQKKWLRPNNSERWHLEETKNKREQEAFLELFKNIGLVDSVLPTNNQYEYLLFMGGDIHGMQERLDFLTHLVKDGLSFKKLVLLTAERPLDDEHELVHLKNMRSFDKLRTNGDRESVRGEPVEPYFQQKNFNHLKTEYDLLQFLYNKSDLPKLLDPSVALTYINTPNLFKDGILYRATTPDTIIDWLKLSPRSGSALVISSQPLIAYQNAVAQTLLPEFLIDSAGPQSSTAVTTPEYFDTLARWLYQEGKLRTII